MIEAAEKTLDDITLAERFDLGELADRAALAEVTRSLEDLFGLPVRLFSQSGRLLADASLRPALYDYLDGFRSSRAAIQELIANIRRVQPEPRGAALHPCVSGAHYRVASVLYEGRAVGRVIFGPFRHPGPVVVPTQLLSLEPGLDENRVQALLAEMPTADEATLEKLQRHLQSVLDLLLFSSLKALLASNMHLASVRESFRELQEKKSKLEAAYERLKELDRLKSNFLATVSHELRTPLTSIIGYSEMLREGIPGDLNEEQLEFVGTIHDKGEQLLALIKSLLDLSKLESGTLSLRRTPMDVGALVRDVVATLTPQARKKGVHLEARVEGDLPPLVADVQRLRQVLLNLSENALKFTPAAGAVRVSASVLQADDELGGMGSILLAPTRPQTIELRVADTGVGIAESERAKVFDAFYQVDSSSTREQGGTGLGLSIVKRLVDAHDGSIRIESNTPQGAVFVVSLPVRSTFGSSPPDSDAR